MPVVPRERVQWSPGLILITLGICLLVQAALSARETQAYLKAAVRTSGVVSDLGAGPAHPLVEFALPSGETLTFAEGGNISYRKGDRVPVVYLPREPETSAHIDDPGALWFETQLSATIGIGLCIAGCCALFLRIV